MKILDNILYFVTFFVTLEDIVDGRKVVILKYFRETAITFAEFFTFQPLKLLDLKTFL